LLDEMGLGMASKRKKVVRIHARSVAAKMMKDGRQVAESLAEVKTMGKHR
jgi:hypothetical protein